MNCNIIGCHRLAVTKDGVCTPHKRERDRRKQLHTIPTRAEIDAHYAAGYREREALEAKERLIAQYKRENPPNVYRSLNGRPEHRVVMERVIGRKLMAHENVHHINGVRYDNRPENLELWSVSQPAGQRIPDKVKWAKQILAHYEPTALAPHVVAQDLAG